MNRKITSPNSNIVRLVQQRESDGNIHQTIQKKLHVTEDFVDRLGLEKELEGHNGCVNCLEWNETGKILASASDDVQVILWDPFLHKKLHTIQTGHHGNIFSVKFLPKSSDNVVATGAGDCRIRVHDISLGESTQVCSCHTGRVKRLATAPNVPYMFWSAAEDGLVMQFDLRTPHSCAREVNVLINLLNHMGRYAEAKCLAINPVRPELLAVGANDPYIRLYDRRMIKPTSIEFPPNHPSWERHNVLANRAIEGEMEDNLPPSCVQYFVAGHLPLKQHDFRKRYRNLASTYLTFSADGNELLVNLGGEQIYLFDINNKRTPKIYDTQGTTFDELKSCKEHCVNSNGYSNGYRGANGFSATSNGVTRNSNRMTSLFPTSANGKRIPLPKKVEALKLRANDAFERQHFTLAINVYNRAITMCPGHAILYGNRAAAYMKRSWDGDVYAAMRDCHTALQLDPDHIKAHFRLARCLFELQWTKEAWECLQAFRSKFPEHAQSQACKALAKDIQTANKAKNNVGNKTSSSTKPKETTIPVSSPAAAAAAAASSRVSVPTIGPALVPARALALAQVPVPAHSVTQQAASLASASVRVSAPPPAPQTRDAMSELDPDEQSGNEHSAEMSDSAAVHIVSPGRDFVSPQEHLWREQASDYEMRFCGHCNTTTDIKEANFFGSQGQYIVAGSDDGSFFIWDRRTTNIKRVLRGDESIVNCLQPHPSYCLLATSGIDPVVRLWSPQPEDGSKNEREVMDLDDAASANQKRMNADPFEVMLMNMGYRITSVQGEEGEVHAEGEARETPPINCRPS